MFNEVVHKAFDTSKHKQLQSTKKTSTDQKTFTPIQIHTDSGLILSQNEVDTIDDSPDASLQENESVTQNPTVESHKENKQSSSNDSLSDERMSKGKFHSIDGNYESVKKAEEKEKKMNESEDYDLARVAGEILKRNDSDAVLKALMAEKNTDTMDSYPDTESNDQITPPKQAPSTNHSHHDNAGNQGNVVTLGNEEKTEAFHSSNHAHTSDEKSVTSAREKESERKKEKEIEDEKNTASVLDDSSGSGNADGEKNEAKETQPSAKKDEADEDVELNDNGKCNDQHDSTTSSTGCSQDPNIDWGNLHALNALVEILAEHEKNESSKKRSENSTGQNNGTNLNAASIAPGSNTSDTKLPGSNASSSLNASIAKLLGSNNGTSLNSGNANAPGSNTSDTKLPGSNAEVYGVPGLPGQSAHVLVVEMVLPNVKDGVFLARIVLDPVMIPRNVVWNHVQLMVVIQIGPNGHPVLQHVANEPTEYVIDIAPTHYLLMVAKAALTRQLETMPCDIVKCPGNGNFTEWSSWTECPRCGKGFRKRLRTCTNPPPINGGNDCEGPSKETIGCPLKKCRDSKGHKLQCRADSEDEDVEKEYDDNPDVDKKKAKSKKLKLITQTTEDIKKIKSQLNTLLKKDDENNVVDTIADYENAGPKFYFGSELSPSNRDALEYRLRQFKKRNRFYKPKKDRR
ncbi:hypothetical protein QZH41_005802 [Actinostola sp. cb2023]|nr:hypothetical protein QZH41_005802 [Actinostola sp. cb2023]